MTVELWTLLTEEQQAKYRETTRTSPSQAAQLLAEYLKSPLFLDDVRQSVRVDLGIRALRRSWAIGLHDAQVNRIFHLSQTVLDSIAEGQSSQEVETLIMAHLLEQTKAAPDLAKGELRPEDAGRIGRLLTDEFLVHFELYRYVFTTEQEREVWNESVEVERPYSHPLSLALAQEEYDRQQGDERARLEAERLAVEDKDDERAAEERRRLVEAETAELNRLQAELDAAPAASSPEKEMAAAVSRAVIEERRKVLDEFRSRETELVRDLDGVKKRIYAAAPAQVAQLAKTLSALPLA